MFAALITLMAHAAPCPQPSEVADFEVAARNGERAFAAMDLPGLTRARADALRILPCLSERVEASVAADFHRMMALAAFTQGDEAQVRAEFHAARRLDPTYAIPEQVVPPGHPLSVLYDRALEEPLDDRGLEPVIPPLGGYVVVDGATDGLRVRGLSALVQVWADDQTLLETVLVMANEPTPVFGPLPIDAVARKRRRITLGTSAGVAGLAAAGLYAGALQAQAEFQDLQHPAPDDELRAIKVRNNALVASSAAAGLLALGLGTGLVILW